MNCKMMALSLVGVLYLVGCVSVESLRAQLNSNDPAVRHAAENEIINITKSCKVNGGPISMEEQYRYVDLLTETDPLLKIATSQYGYSTVRKHAAMKIQFKTNEQALQILQMCLKDDKEGNLAELGAKAATYISDAQALEAHYRATDRQRHYTIYIAMEKRLSAIGVDQEILGKLVQWGDLNDEERANAMTRITDFAVLANIDSSGGRCAEKAAAKMSEGSNVVTFRDLQQLVKTSRLEKTPLPWRRLVSLYRFGERKSPWEELSRSRLTGLAEELGKRVKGQDHVIAKVDDVIKRAYLGLSGLQHSSKQQMPKGIFFFVGPTGVGKTEMAKALANFLFGEEEACLRFDMSEYNAEHSDQRLLGAPPGYVGYEAGGQLTNAVRARPFSVLLFDEIEKAHNKIFDKFLQILEDGRLTDGKGDTFSFSETVIIFTSNIGASDVSPNDPDAAKAFMKAVASS